MFPSPVGSAYGHRCHDWSLWVLAIIVFIFGMVIKNRSLFIHCGPCHTPYTLTRPNTCATVVNGTEEHGPDPCAIYTWSWGDVGLILMWCSLFWYGYWCGAGRPHIIDTYHRHAHEFMETEMEKDGEKDPEKP